MRILIKTSKTAIWARRFGSLAVPLVIISVALHYLGLIDSPSFLVAILAAGGVAALAVLFGLLALVRLWFSGDQGWSKALMGVFLGLICLVPFAHYGMLAWRYPPVTDMATTSRGDLPLVFEPDTFHMPQPQVLTPEQQETLFPNAATRHYPLDPAQLFSVVQRLIAARGWDIRLARAPTEADPIGRINARIVTIPGWREEVVFRIVPDPEGSAIDMRSASINAPHDFGSNGDRISEFMAALDEEVTTLLRDNPNVAEPAAPDEPAPAVDTEPAD